MDFGLFQNILGNEVNGEIIFAGSDTASEYLLVGTDLESPLVRRNIVLRLDNSRSRRGIYYVLEPIINRSGRFHLRAASFDRLNFSRTVVLVMRAFQLLEGNRPLPTREQMKGCWLRIMDLRKREKERKAQKEDTAIKAELFDDDEDGDWTF